MDEIISGLDEVISGLNEAISNLQSMIDAPAVDAVEVVRCIDCKHLGFKDFRGICETGPVCGAISPDSFCAWGQRREDGDGDGLADGAGAEPAE